MRTAGWLVAAVAGVGALAACGRGPAAGPSWSERQATAEKRELWSMEAEGAKAAPVVVCTDIAMRLGFVKPVPSAGGAPCIRLNRPVERPGSYAFRCQLAGEEWAVVSTWTGDASRDLTVAMSVSSLDNPNVAYAQTRRYRRLGACPAGWSIGESRDRQGRSVSTLMDWPAAASAPP